MRIGLLSDTHLPHRLPHLPARIIEIFEKADLDLILHAGDVDDPRFLEPLSHLAPVIAVRGNVHPQDLSRGGAELPLHVELTLHGRRLIVTHGHRTGPIGLGYRIVAVTAMKLGLLSRRRINQTIARRLHRRFPHADVVVFGHTHEAFQTWLGNTFFFNPGGVLRSDNLEPTVGILTIEATKLKATIVPLFL